LRPEEPVLVALSGGADSVLLLHLAATARPRTAVRAVHVDHNLRGKESRDDARFWDQPQRCEAWRRRDDDGVHGGRPSHAPRAFLQRLECFLRGAIQHLTTLRQQQRARGARTASP
jgi:hypothetical protein